MGPEQIQQLLLFLYSQGLKLRAHPGQCFYLPGARAAYNGRADLSEKGKAQELLRRHTVPLGDVV